MNFGGLFCLFTGRFWNDAQLHPRVMFFLLFCQYPGEGRFLFDHKTYFSAKSKFDKLVKCR